MAYDFSTVDHLKMSDNGKESEPLSPTFKANNLRNVPLTPTFGLSPRSKQHERMEEGVGVDISWDDDQSEFKPNYDASYRASAIQWVRRNKKKSYLFGAGIFALIGVVTLTSTKKIQANRHKAATSTATGAVSSAKTPKSKIDKLDLTQKLQVAAKSANLQH